MKKVQFYYKGKSITAIIRLDSEGFYLSTVLENGSSKCNDYLFRLCGYRTLLEKKTLYLQVLGYWPEEYVGDTYWPWCKTAEDVNKIVIHLVKKLIGNSKFIDLRFHLV